MPRVAVIGAGPLGLIALKTLKEDGFDVVGYETRPYVGGLWKYSEDSGLSVTERTIFNTSRFRSAMSDFPFPEDTNDYPTWQQMHRYLESYCDHFDLRRHINLNSPVTNLARKEDQWILEISPPGLPRRCESFERVVVAIGSFVKPKSPNFDGIEQFEGPNLHAINFNQPAQYSGKNILLVGLHSTAQDVAVTLSGHASKLYISHKNGAVLFPRYTSDGAVFENSQTLAILFLQLFMTSWFPKFTNWLLDRIVRIISARAYPNMPKSWNFSPGPSVAVTPLLMGDELFPLLKSGFAEPVPSVRRITGPKSVELTDGRVLSDVDAIIYCTGYDMCVPFIEADLNPYPTVGKPSNLYRGIFPLHPDPAVRNSLAYLGHGAVPFSFFVQSELIAMAVSQIWLGKSHLPPFAEMKLWHRKFLAWREHLIAGQKIKSTFYVAMMPQADYLQWLDEMAGAGVFEHFGWLSAKAWQFWWTDKTFYNTCLNGLLSPAIWRLFDSGKRKAWPRAREQILQDNVNVEHQIRKRNAMIKHVGTKAKI